ncbi:dihydrolipoamide acetyltransferase : Pyruvate dehydrogenase E2 component OS=Melioribacter roseus (strain JCM 17771 / P3M-2) GN=MROS_0858 PE=3 SV=1: Biotin_lipoyl: Biotin_lipoyl: E3_binding: 2-oxoacid_dh [Gemmata massiliana]|uniref:Dihydrolipoamide acetyltransferase component of pyruvate dehydrogenase complex n=1 Tax=Gemmata massiliana TaxID=1210884 RepID=A0A6P2D359_9BACT|nr:2-oxo acid dehydrogenase subunit E2 [Gemmata massiliana]VTR94544.1 dihydrolipoamide acetyltransferase : Pyruvate dehydrogenase E2 component OS=Melioribacter roseus (strain JCM 17771 / P3M-2) GN=MROS_0858 PE=3 SV=1: Biotin_lipoyl: Biotin_lipoyl: E3_binding: 2-oxoacid_dh [Gemmata massiliana]
MDIVLANPGEGIEGGTVTAVFVKVGDAVKSGQALVEVSTDKASMEVTAESDGTVEAVHVKPGDKVSVGGKLIRVSGGAKPSEAPAPKNQPQQKAEAPAAPAPHAKTEAPTAAASVDVVLANPGEGIEGGTVTAVFVKVGDAVKSGQALVEVSTDKASMEVTAESDGTVEAVHVKPGDKVSVGGKLVTLKAAGATSNAPKASTPVPAQQTAPKSAPAASQPQAQPASNNGSANGTKTLVPAGPATRKLARELGVALGELKGSGREGRVTLDDLKGFVRTERQRVKESGGVVAPASGIIVNAFALPPLPDFAKFGPVEVTEVATIRQTIAKNLTVGWRTMPMVTQHELADITDLEAGRKRIVDALPKGSPKITMTVLAIKACIAALKEFPRFNSSYDMNAGKLVLKKYFHIGIAVDTDAGLKVPVIRDADKKSIRDLAAEVSTIAEKARTNKLTIDEMRGGTFTITNLGGIGGTGFTPLVNYPEVAILGLSKSSLQPIVRDGQIVARLMMPLSLTYDHRVIDGADGCRFTVRLAQLFSDPLRLLMET